MLGRRGTATLSELRVRLAAEPVSVPGARRFVADGLAFWGRPALVEDAALCITEMASNAALHSASGFMDVSVQDRRDSVRICVEDEGPAPVQAVVPPLRAVAGSGDLEDEPTTGRGLMIVSILARDWGVEETVSGKRIWADISSEHLNGASRSPQMPSEPAQVPSVHSSLPDGWGVVRLLGCPVELALRSDQHLDELIRELQLINADEENPPSRQIARVIEGLLQAPAFARHTARRIVQEAAAAGLDVVDVEMTLPRQIAATVRDLERAVRRADALCERAELLTLASTPELRAIRTWMAECLVTQPEGTEPISYADWLARTH